MSHIQEDFSLLSDLRTGIIQDKFLFPMISCRAGSNEFID